MALATLSGCAFIRTGGVECRDTSTDVYHSRGTEYGLARAAKCEAKPGLEHAVWSGDGRRLAANQYGKRGRLRVFAVGETAALDPVWTARSGGHPGLGSTMAFTSDDRILIGIGGGSIKEFDSASGRVLREYTPPLPLEGFEYSVFDASLSPDDRYVAAHFTGYPRLGDGRRGLHASLRLVIVDRQTEAIRVVHYPRDEKLSVTDLHFLSRGRILLAGTRVGPALGERNAVLISFDLHSGRFSDLSALYPNDERLRYVRDMDVDPSSRLVAVTAMGKLGQRMPIEVRRVSNGELVHRLSGEYGPKSSVSFLDENRLVICSSGPNERDRLQVVDLRTGEKIFALKAPASERFGRCRARGDRIAVGGKALRVFALGAKTKRREVSRP